MSRKPQVTALYRRWISRLQGRFPVTIRAAAKALPSGWPFATEAGDALRAWFFETAAEQVPTEELVRLVVKYVKDATAEWPHDQADDLKRVVALVERLADPRADFRTLSRQLSISHSVAGLANIGYWIHASQASAASVEYAARMAEAILNAHPYGGWAELALKLAVIAAPRKVSWRAILHDLDTISI